MTLIPEIRDAKLKLASLLLPLQSPVITDNEIDILYLLIKDEDIQEVLERSKIAEKTGGKDGK